MLPSAGSAETSLLKRISKRILDDAEGESWLNADLIVAVSGGPDSVAIFRILHHLKTTLKTSGALRIAHCHHQTRPENDGEAAFVRELADQFQVDADIIVRPTRADGPQNPQKNSEDTLRSFRYHALHDVARKTGIRYIVTGHHANDQIETILFRIFRGTGLSGLQGIPRLRVESDVTLIRPLLDIRRAILVDLLAQLKQQYCDDSSNQATQFARNFLRLEIIPNLSQRFGDQFAPSILRLKEQADEIQNFLDELSSPLIATALERRRGDAVIDIRHFQNQHPLIVGHALRRVWQFHRFPEQGMSREKWKDLTNQVVSSSPQQQQFPGHVRATIQGNELQLTIDPYAKR